MKRWLLAVIVCSLVASGCSRYKKVTELEDSDSSQKETEESAVKVSALPGEKPVKVKGIYISGYMAGSEGMEKILDKIKGTEINTVVIDVKMTMDVLLLPCLERLWCRRSVPKNGASKIWMLL